MEVQVESFLRFLDQQEEYSERTRQAYASDLQRYLEFMRATLGRVPSIQDITSQTVAQFISYENQLGKSYSTLHRRRASLRRFVQFLKSTGQVELAPILMDVALPPNGKPPETGLPSSEGLTAQEVERVRATIAEDEHSRALRDLAIFELLVGLGISIGMLVALDLSDVDLRAGRLRLKIGRDGAYWVGARGLTPLLARYILEGRPDLSPAAGEQALFVSQMGGRMSRQGIWQVLRNWGRLAQLSKELSPRVIRYTAAQRMLRQGRSLTEMQKLLGHRNLLSTRALARRLRSDSIKTT